MILRTIWLLLEFGVLFGGVLVVRALLFGDLYQGPSFLETLTWRSSGSFTGRNQ